MNRCPARPTILTREVVSIEDDPNNASNMIVTVRCLALNMGVPQQELVHAVSVANSLNKAQVKTAINSEIIADVAARYGKTIGANDILTVGDLVG